MRIKWFTAPTMRQALTSVKSDFGPQAVILLSKPIKKGGFLGIGGKNWVEVLAGIDINVGESTGKSSIVSDGNRIDPSATKFTPPQLPKDPPGPSSLGDASVVVNRMPTSAIGTPDRMAKWRHQFRNRGIDDGFIEKFFQNLHGQAASVLADDATVMSAMQSAIQSEIRVDGMIEIRPDETQCIAFVGPTGVGKTTTIAKIAANYRLYEGKKIGLITIDTYRIAAIEQLKTFANIVHIDLKVVYTPEEFREAIHAWEGYELILIDTAGRSPHHRAHMGELAQFLSAAGREIQTYLVVSATMKREDIQDTISRFSQLSIHHLILTKTDETTRYGTILDITHWCKQTIAYVTTGQNVPDDIQIADPKILAEMIVNPQLVGVHQ